MGKPEGVERAAWKDPSVDDTTALLLKVEPPTAQVGRHPCLHSPRSQPPLSLFSRTSLPYTLRTLHAFVVP